MAEHNPYLPPRAAVVAEVGPSHWSLFAIAGCAEMGAVIALAYLPISYEMVRIGAVAPLFLVATVASMLCLLISGVLTFMRRRNVIYLLAVACAFALIALIFWRSIFSVAHAFFAATSAIQAFHVFRPTKKKP